MTKRLLYTVITGNYDEVNPCPKYPGWDYLLITDNPNIRANSWPVKVVDTVINAVKTQRYWKINSHLLGYDLTCYIDGNMVLKLDPFPIANKYFKGGVLLVDHPSRKCVTTESEAILQAKKDKPEIMRPQIGKYIAENMPFNFGMYASGFMIRDNSLKDFESLWWSELEKHSHRDQLSLPYALWKKGIKPNTIPYSTLIMYVKINQHTPNGGIKIWYSNPYSIDKNFGKAINEFCEIVPNDEDWIVIQDGDICYLTPDWGRIVYDSLREHGHKFGLIGCYTNCLNGLHQLHGKRRVNDIGMKQHHEIASKYDSTNISDLGNLGVAGFFMAFQKKTWKSVGGFVENSRTFDTSFNIAVRKKGLKIGIMDGLYVYHLYRIWADGNPAEDIKHLE